MNEQTPTSRHFAYRAQTPAGLAVSGTIVAATAEDAQRLLSELELRVTEIGPTQSPTRPRALSGDDFVAFNQQLAQLAKSGLPLERGLRLIALDMGKGRLAATVRLVADELEKGTPLAEAFEKHRGQFPSLYGRVIDAGVRSGNLPGVLFSLGQHANLVQRLRAVLWRAAAYPMTVLLMVALVVLFISLYIVPSYREIFVEFDTAMPWTTEALFAASRYLPPVIIVGLLLVLVWPLIWSGVRAMGRDQWVIEMFVMPIPLLGSVLRQNQIARWCDAVKVGVDAGMDLPGAMSLAAETIGSPLLTADTRALVESLSRGGSLQDARITFIPAAVAATMELSSKQSDLAAALDRLGQMYRERTEIRLSLVQAAVTPVMLAVLAAVIGFTVVSLMMPLISLIQGVS